MNAIVGLCHFCEAHGPKPLFCTFTSDNEDHATDPSISAVQCNGCTSIGTETVFVSRESNGTIFCSRQSLPNAEIATFLRQAALRCITCEVSWNKEGGVVYFSDTQGHVLSYTFQIKDTRARGLIRMFSIVVLMKDKLMLLNITPALSEHMQRISRELQKLAEVVFEEEQRVCSQRALRLKTGVYEFGQSRSLVQLTGHPDIFKKLHSHFTHILRTGAATYTETLYTSADILNKINNNATRGTIFQDNICEVKHSRMSIRDLETLLTRPVFRHVLYCTLVGKDVVINTRSKQPNTIVATLINLLPNASGASHIKSWHPNSKIESNVCHLQESEKNNFECKWNGTLPNKCPTLMIKVEKGIENDKFNDAVLNQYIKSIQLEWLGIANTLKTAIKSSNHKSEAVNSLKQLLGIKPEDESLVTFWSRNFCN
ncbi:folliculin [Aricia agestis]|uniref:folliculin n=1 Tax=Aricia agestis TaxID=91739 RepID=UPI001C2030CC|nr:folliculin [Aricia agestis]